MEMAQREEQIMRKIKSWIGSGAESEGQDQKIHRESEMQHYSDLYRQRGVKF